MTQLNAREQESCYCNLVAGHMPSLNIVRIKGPPRVQSRLPTIAMLQHTDINIQPIKETHL